MKNHIGKMASTSCVVIPNSTILLLSLHHADKYNWRRSCHCFYIARITYIWCFWYFAE